MLGKTIIVEYHGKRFPRVVALRNGKKVNFHEDRKFLELEEYDALFLLKSNIRMTPEKFEFSIMGVVGDEEEVLEKDEEDQKNSDEDNVEDKKEDTKPKGNGLKIKKHKK